ncbi:MAG: isoprenylcysteine carboxylmethyltransferase family protein [Thermoplasmata archaeon]|nr:MAG: isoprenylcysteine carboxylmethyltransferase family protein [Thermoplasmata archaeon]
MDWADPARRWNLVARVALVAFGLSSLMFWDHFAAHFRAHLSGSIIDDVITGEWHVVVFNIALFTSFLIPLTFRRKADWKEYTIVVAFIVSLFIEMYGIPLLIVLVAGRYAPESTPPLEEAFVIEFLGVEFYFTVPMVYGAVLIMAGMALIIVGWVQLFRGVKEDALVTTGVYAVSRNPQYLGFMMIVLGWWVGWPTLLVTVFAPILFFLYYRLCRVEEGEVGDLPGFSEYQRTVPLVI